MMEGFICPECRQNFQTSGLLETHFNSHFQGPSSIRNMFSKAKDYTLSWITNEEEYVPSPSSRPSTSSPKVSPRVEQEQLIGHMNNLTKLFRAVRPKRVSHSQKEANKLLIRLDKLVTAVLSEMQAGKRDFKDVEKSIIPWIDDPGDAVCAGCEETLSILSRKHHCRLCTGLLCSPCSLFVPIEDALVAVGNPLPELIMEHSFRLCPKCQHVIDSAREEIKAKKVDRTMEQSYDKLLDAQNKCDSFVAEYNKIAAALRAGESTYTLDQGNDQRIQLVRQFKIVDTLSERILAIRTKSPTQLKVQTNIRQTVRAYLQDNLPATAPLPELKEVKLLQDKRLEENRAQIQQEKQEALRTLASKRHTPPPPHFTIENTDRPDGWSTKSKRDQISRDMSRERTARAQSGSPQQPARGWMSETVQQPRVHSHPLIEQRELVRGYLRQAIKDGREEESETLKQNLHMIIDEIKAQELDDT